MTSEVTLKFIFWHQVTVLAKILALTPTVVLAPFPKRKLLHFVTSRAAWAAVVELPCTLVTTPTVKCGWPHSVIQPLSLQTMLNRYGMIVFLYFKLEGGMKCRWWADMIAEHLCYRPNGLFICKRSRSSPQINLGILFWILNDHSVQVWQKFKVVLLHICVFRKYMFCVQLSDQAARVVHFAQKITPAYPLYY